jgi:hypothetical protein
VSNSAITVDVVRKENGKWKFAHRMFDQLRVADYAGFDEMSGSSE